MKKIITGKLFMAALLFYSCSKKEASINNKLSGQWNLINVTCECRPSDLEYGEHVWIFDLTNNMLSVKNTVEKPLQILETGNYEFDLTDSTIKIKTVTYDYYFKEDKLFLADHPELDGPLMEFLK